MTGLPRLLSTRLTRLPPEMLSVIIFPALSLKKQPLNVEDDDDSAAAAVLRRPDYRRVQQPLYLLSILSF